MDALSDLGSSEVAPEQGRPHVLWNVCRSSSAVETVAGGMRSNLGIVFK